MHKHEMELPHFVVIGHDLAQTIVDHLKLHGFKAPLMITSNTPYRVYGSKIESLMDLRIKLSTLDVEEIYGDVEKVIQGRGFDVILGVGGGRVMDVSKVVAEKTGKPFISIPTIASHDGIASPMTSYRQNGKAYSRKSVMPLEIYADIDVISRSPRRYLMSGCGDLVAKHSAVRDWWLAHRETGEYYGRYAAHLAYLSGSVIIRSAKEIRNNSLEGVRTVVEALISAGVAMGVAGSSRPCSGGEHLIAHALETLMEKPALHGERCGVATIFTLKLHGANWEKVKESLKTIGAPHTLKDINVDEELFTEAVKLAPNLRKERYTILHKKQLDEAEIENIINETGLI